MKKCLICNKVRIYPICNKCKVDPFRVEKCRQILAEAGQLIDLKKMYSSSLSEIQDLNTAIFWDKKLDKIIPLNTQDGMTQDRVKYTAKFLPKDIKRVLDIGAGYGFVEELISKREGIELYGNDISPEAIKNLKKRFKGNFRVESLYNMEYKNNQFDAVLALEVLEHIPPSRILKVLRRIYKLLKKNGYFILSVPMNEGLELLEDNPNGHMRDYTIPLIASELKLVGFNVITYKTFYAFSNLYLIKNLLSRIFKNRWKPNNIVIKAQK